VPGVRPAPAQRMELILRRMTRRDVTWPGAFIVIFILGTCYVLTGNGSFKALIMIVGVLVLMDIGRTLGKDGNRSGETRT
jgi:preprotein translocase subunit SecY